MRIFIVDDETAALEEAKEAVAEALPEAEIHTFTRAADALSEADLGGWPEVVFSDIEMPGLSGLSFAVRVKSLSPDTRIIFLTGYSEYAIEAFRMKVHGYLLKPVTVEAVREELSHLPEMKPAAMDKLCVRCFGHFDVSYRGKPVIFTRKQSKELLAYLICRNGAACTSEEIALALWEEGGDRKAELVRVRRLISDLKASLKAIGMEDLLIREHRQLAIQRERIDCDYFRMLDGDMDAVNAYTGEFMMEYSWAEMENASLYFRK